MKIYIRVDAYTDVLTIEYFDYLTALSALGGLAACLYKPTRFFLNYYTKLNFVAKIVKEIYYIRQTKE